MTDFANSTKEHFSKKVVGVLEKNLTVVSPVLPDNLNELLFLDKPEDEELFEEDVLGDEIDDTASETSQLGNGKHKERGLKNRMTAMGQSRGRETDAQGRKTGA